MVANFTNLQSTRRKKSGLVEFDFPQWSAKTTKKTENCINIWDPARELKKIMKHKSDSDTNNSLIPLSNFKEPRKDTR